MTADRRQVLGGAAAGLGLMPFLINGVVKNATAAEARAKGAAFKVLTVGEVRTLEAFGEVLLPGAASDGIAHFVDHHIGVDPADSLLMLRYLDVPPPYAGFYKGGLAALDTHAKAQGALFADLAADKQAAIVKAISAAQPEGWAGPPAPLFYFAVRADAVDVVYGTVEGFAKLGVPYMEHILPETRW